MNWIINEKKKTVNLKEKNCLNINNLPDMSIFGVSLFSIIVS